VRQDALFSSCDPIGMETRVKKVSAGEFNFASFVGVCPIGCAVPRECLLPCLPLIVACTKSAA